jgi:hypothetical protein
MNSSVVGMDQKQDLEVFTTNFYESCFPHNTPLCDNAVQERG